MKYETTVACVAYRNLRSPFTTNNHSDCLTITPMVPCGPKTHAYIREVWDVRLIPRRLLSRLLDKAVLCNITIDITLDTALWGMCPVALKYIPVFLLSNVICKY